LNYFRAVLFFPSDLFSGTRNFNFKTTFFINYVGGIPAWGREDGRV